jgi:hypothetical protein
MARTSTLHRWLPVVVGLCLLCMLSSAILAWLEVRAWQQLGKQLGIEATHAALDDHIIHTVIKSGMPRQEVHLKLDSIAPNVTHQLLPLSSKTCEIVFFSIGPIPILEPGYDICYTLEDELIYISTVD